MVAKLLVGLSTFSKIGILPSISYKFISLIYELRKTKVQRYLYLRPKVVTKFAVTLFLYIR